MTHLEKFERRKRIADAVRSGKTPGEVARAERVSLNLVREACRENGVSTARQSTQVAAQVAH